MLESIMGKDKLILGLNAYLNKYKYSNTITNDLWDAVNDQVYKFIDY